MTSKDPSGSLRHAWLQLSEEARPRADCPAAEQIWDAATGAQQTAAVREIIEHTALCPVCAEAWRLARGLEKPSAVPVADRSEGPPRRLRWAVAAALVVATVALSIYRRQPTEPVVERTSELAVESQIEDGAPLARDRFILRWEPGPSGSRYDLLVTTSDLEVIVRASALSEAHYQVSPDLLEALAPGEVVLWRVELVLPGGRSIASPAFRATLR